MRRTTRNLAVTALAVMASTAGVALATFTSSVSASQTISTATLAPPTGLAATRPNATGPNDGNAALSWTPSAGGIASGQTVLGGTSSTGPWTTLATLGAATSTYTDATAPYNGQVFYQVQATRNLWTANSATAMSLSLPMAAGTDLTSGTGSGTALTGPWTTSGTQLAALSAPDGTRYTPGTWPAAASGLAEVGVVDATHAWAVGAGGVILQGDGTGAWTTLSSGTTQNLAGVAFASTTTGWAVGSGPSIYATTNGGTTWTTQPSGTPQPLAAVACATTSLCWAVGGKGAIVNTTDGNKWKGQGSGVPGSLFGISCSSSSACVAVGAGGAVTVLAGNKWKAVKPSPTTSDLNAVSCPTASQCWAVGASGTILASGDGGNTWTAQSSGTTQALRGVDMLSASAGYAVGDGGTALTTTNGGATWTALAGLAGSGQGVSCADATHCVVVASTGLPAATANGGATWTSGYSGYLALTPLAPAVASGIPLTGAQARVVLQTTTVPPSGSSAMLLASADGGNTWQSYPLTLPTQANTDLTQTIDLSAQVAGATVGNLQLRLAVLPASGTLTTAIDLVHVDASG